MATSVEPDPRIPAEALLALVTAIFERRGMTAADARLLADSLVVADLRGVNSHGVMRVPEYVKKLGQGGVNPRGRPAIARDDGACLVVDGGNCMGQIAAQFATERTIERATTTGIAATAVRGSNHCGAMAYFALQATHHDMIGLATTNALPTMAPWGGAERLLGIDPLAIAIPSNEEPPIVYDAAFSGSAHGKIRIYQQRGQTLPEGWALDRDGRPTTDPAAAIDGLLVPIGGFKGAGLAMIMGILSSMLSGASYGTELGDMEHGPTAGQDGHFIAAIRVGAFEDVGRFKARVDQAIRQVHACRLAPGFDRVYAPGEKEFLAARENRAHGIPLDRVTLSGLRRTAADLGLSVEKFVSPRLFGRPPAAPKQP
ncbi:MAG TPA: Ldh family oxidoreductase, partial [Chloroflexota bacterium]|nr:Ldh family oxidoreductase [Chloroflexota bacterium]